MSEFGNAILTGENEVIRVRSYNREESYHFCDIGAFKGLRIDLMVNGDFPEGTSPEELVGKEFTCDYLHAHEFIAMHVKPFTPQPPKEINQQREV